MDPKISEKLDRAAELINQADAFVISAGAGMGVDSGLPDFRGNEGFWNAYPPYARLGLGFSSLANPQWFNDDPAFAWGFYGHRRNLYRATQPHEGFALLKRLAEIAPRGAFVYTSNVDAHFEKAGFDHETIVEVHGSIEYSQCLANCGLGFFRAENVAIEIDETTMKAAGPLPQCPSCGSLARPNILMFGDWGWDSSRTDAQFRRFQNWLDRNRVFELVVIECGAGTAIPTVRHMSQELVNNPGAKLIRINVREPEVPRSQIGIPLGALEALSEIDGRLRAAR